MLYTSYTTCTASDSTCLDKGLVEEGFRDAQYLQYRLTPLGGVYNGPDSNKLLDWRLAKSASWTASVPRGRVPPRRGGGEEVNRALPEQ